VSINGDKEPPLYYVKKMKREMLAKENENQNVKSLA